MKKPLPPSSCANRKTPPPEMTRPGQNARNRLWPVLLLLLLGSTACTSIPDESRKLETRNVTIEYHDKQRDREIDGIDLQHPFSINGDTMEAQIKSVFYEHLALVSKPEPVFNKVQLPDLKRLLTKALNHARPDHYISFKIKGDGGETEGDLFASNGRLHWRLNKIDGEAFTRQAWARNEQRWRLAPRSGQKYYTKKILMERDIHNWIVSPIQTAPPKPQRMETTTPREPAAPVPAAAPAPTAKEQELERKLGILNKLRDKQLIDEAEYERRRKALLDEYF